MKRQVKQPEKQNFLRQNERQARQTEVVAYPTSSYNPHNTWTAGERDSKLGQLAQSLREFSPAIQGLLGQMSDERVAKDTTQGEEDAVTQKTAKAGATAAYLAAYYRIKARGDAADVTNEANKLLNKADTLTPEEWEQQKQALFSQFATKEMHPFHREALMPMLSDISINLDVKYNERQLQIVNQTRDDNLAKGAYDAALKYGNDTTVFGKELDKLRDDAALLGLGTKEANTMLVNIIGRKAAIDGNEKLLDVFMLPYKKRAAYDTDLAPAIDAYRKQAQATKRSREEHGRTTFLQNEARWNNMALNKFEVEISKAKGDPGRLAAIQARLYDTMLHPTKEGFVANHAAFGALLDDIARIQKGTSGGLSESDWDVYENLRENIIYGNVRTYDQIAPFYKDLRAPQREKLMGFIDKMNNKDEASDSQAAKRAAVASLYRSKFDNFVKTESSWLERMQEKPGKVLSSYDTLIESVPIENIGKTTDELIKALTDKKADAMKKAIDDIYANLQKQQQAPTGRIPKVGNTTQAGKTIVREGIYKGKKVIQYSDGTVEYAK